jgi:hypothetical protein
VAANRVTPDNAVPVLSISLSQDDAIVRSPPHKLMFHY